MLLALIVFLVACAIIGYRIISSVPSLLHTPLMSGMNALSGITVLGAIAVFATATSGIVLFLSGAALVLAMINVVGGFWVTDRMLKMFDSSARRTDK
ncbi:MULTISPECIES: NAD(P) transhydrogenase subunit alpha [Mesotoga]|uniref:NAD(P) transhydrogenase subunit alpha n=1 Tax=Mesotoga TaxID=1184396 RepID=UPI0002C94955|nr:MULTISPECIES: NAD(P) transhydrogenase subunit alpha [Mesotoga]MCP5456441.1 NAD(P) transhydrogenase subunit alpha [Thermotogota bacterium]CCU85705.1 NAD(P) transhydrogenase subunit alpha PntAB [Mesotoga infera]MDD3461948.1 NAD(P) transhydrogenase subunit alpha [Mesotoga sp.]HNQ70262.1 NAD(P) transhydrogenase subunit alpha [Mesotoga prima]HNS74713.1 NAD(P) transhydrogenase subunit alpha [Mesotoga prima]